MEYVDRTLVPLIKYYLKMENAKRAQNTPGCKMKERNATQTNVSILRYFYRMDSVSNAQTIKEHKRMVEFVAQINADLLLKSELTAFVAQNTPGLKKTENASQTHALEGKSFFIMANACIVPILKEHNLMELPVDLTYVNIIKKT